jgi:hypothetical protein
MAVSSIFTLEFDPATRRTRRKENVEGKSTYNRQEIGAEVISEWDVL